ncbi:MAG TPA: response regulator transcription factor [Pyrinomonadaceae bacterium]
MNHIDKKNIRVVVADDNEPLRKKLIHLLESYFDVVGAAADGKTALELIMLTNPDVAVLDISMPFMTGIEVTAELSKNLSDTKIVIFTIHRDPDFVRAALDAGATGYVLKSDLVKDLTTAVLNVYEGKVFVSPNCALYQS